VPGLAVPLYSLRTHVTQRGCGFFGTQDSGFLVYFPSFVLSVFTTVDCHLSFTPLGTSAPLHTLDYVQPRCTPSPYPVTPFPAVSNATPSQFLPALIESDDIDNDVLPDGAPSPPSLSQVDLSDISRQLRHFTSVIDKFTSVSPSLVNPPVPIPSPSADVSPTPPVVDDESPSRLLSTMSPTEITNLLHREGSSFPSVRPCDTVNGFDTKTHWSSEELHRIMGCRKFRNCKHIIQVSRDGEWVDGGQFPLSLVHTPRLRNRSAVALSTRLGTNTLTQSIWTSRLGIASVSGVFAMPSFLLIGLPAITGPLDCRVFRLRRFCRQYGLSCPLLLLRL